jgi:hypothetical protein
MVRIRFEDHFAEGFEDAQNRSAAHRGPFNCESSTDWPPPVGIHGGLLAW